MQLDWLNKYTSYWRRMSWSYLGGCLGSYLGLNTRLVCRPVIKKQTATRY